MVFTRNISTSTSLPGPLSILNGVANQAGAEVLRTIVYGSMPDVVRRRFDFPWSTADRLRFLSICGALRAMDPAVRRGALSDLFPEGTPRLAPGTRDTVIITGARPRQHRRTTNSTAA